MINNATPSHKTFTPLSALAKDLSMHRTHVKRFVIKNGFNISKIRTRESGHQETLAVSNEDAQALIDIRKRWGLESVPIESGGKGLFYIIQPLPDIADNRVKLGFATDTKQRLNQYRTICPNASILKSWPCHSTWERCVIASLSRIECEQIGTEMYQCKNVKSLIERGNKFFSMLPNPHA